MVRATIVTLVAVSVVGAAFCADMMAWNVVGEIHYGLLDVSTVSCAGFPCYLTVNDDLDYNRRTKPHLAHILSLNSQCYVRRNLTFYFLVVSTDQNWVIKK